MSAARTVDKSLEDIGQHIRSRRTVKLFLKRPVSRKLVLDAVEAARWAPNHHVTEPWHFYLLGAEAIAASVELTRLVTAERKGAKIGDFKAASAAAIPGWLVVTCRHTPDDERREREDYASCCCAIQNFMLYLSAAGAASKWSTGSLTRDRRFLDLLGIDTDAEFIVGLIWHGYPRVFPEQSRKDVDEIVTETT